MGIATERVPLTDHERTLLTNLGNSARTENAAAASRITQIMSYIDSRGTYEHRAPHTRFDTDLAHRSAIAEIALALSVSHQAVKNLIRLGYTLARIPDAADAFTAGELSLGKIRVIDERTRAATGAALRRLSEPITAAARRLAPTPLGTEIDRLLIEDDADWAARARKEAETRSKVRTRTLPHGMGTITVTLTATQLATLTNRILEAAKTVCYADPRTIDQRCADAFLTLTRGSNQLACQCELTDCLARGNPTPPTPDIHVNINCGLDALLGLADNPAHLDGYGYLDPEQLRELAGDATWQALIDFATDTLERLYTEYGDYEHHPIDFDLTPTTDEDDDTAADPHTDESVNSPTSRNEDTVIKDADPAPNNPSPQHDSGLIICRSRILPAGAQPHRSRPDPLRTPRQRAAHLDALRRQLHTDPAAIHALFPDGHGGFTNPPPGATTYRPNTTLAAAIKLRDGTCRHPDCTAPAERCQIDHIVPFDHQHPWLGGWTIATNLHCLCVLHHQLKTARLWHYDMLADAVIHTHNTIGQHDITLPILRRRYD